MAPPVTLCDDQEIVRLIARLSWSRHIRASLGVHNERCCEAIRGLTQGAERLPRDRSRGH
jgi:hypothetical protein